MQNICFQNTLLGAFVGIFPIQLLWLDELFQCLGDTGSSLYGQKKWIWNLVFFWKSLRKSEFTGLLHIRPINDRELCFITLISRVTSKKGSNVSETALQFKHLTAEQEMKSC